jgi:pyrroline-5-carboxylate reductase
VTAANGEAVAESRVVLLCVKPQVLAEVIPQIASLLTDSHLLVSILAGISTGLLEKKLGKKIPVVRVMPNTPALVGQGMAAICPGRYAREEDLEEVEKIIGAVGEVARVKEELMNLVTALSGSGPAYLFLFTEALAAAGRELGMDGKLADLLARRTVTGASALLAQSGETPAALREKVTSPGGTTAAALKVLEEEGFSRLLRRAVKAARRRGEELQREAGSETVN